MAPTICLPELSMQGNATESCSSCRASNYGGRNRRLNQNNINNRKEQQRIEFKRIFNRTRSDHRRCDVTDYLSPPASPVWEPAPTLDNHVTTSQSDTGDLAVSNIRNRQHWRSVYSRREGLLEIVARTMTLVRRSHALQKRVNALGYETREFIRSVLNNPENNVTSCGDSAESKTHSICSSTSEKSVENSDSHSYREVHLLSRPTPPATPDSSTGSDEVDFLTDKDKYLSETDKNENQDTRDKVTQDPMVSSS